MLVVETIDIDVPEIANCREHKAERDRIPALEWVASIHNEITMGKYYSI